MDRLSRTLSRWPLLPLLGLALAGLPWLAMRPGTPPCATEVLPRMTAADAQQAKVAEPVQPEILRPEGPARWLSPGGDPNPRVLPTGFPVQQDTPPKAKSPAGPQGPLRDVRWGAKKLSITVTP